MYGHPKPAACQCAAARGTERVAHLQLAGRQHRELPSPALGQQPCGSGSAGARLGPHRIYKYRVVSMEICLFTGNVLTGPAANSALPCFHHPKVPIHLPPHPSIPGRELQQERQYEVTREMLFPQKSLVQ